MPRVRKMGWLAPCQQSDNNTPLAESYKACLDLKQRSINLSTKELLGPGAQHGFLGAQTAGHYHSEGSKLETGGLGLPWLPSLRPSVSRGLCCLGQGLPV